MCFENVTCLQGCFLIHKMKTLDKVFKGTFHESSGVGSPLFGCLSTERWGKREAKGHQTDRERYRPKNLLPLRGEQGSRGAL